MSEGEVGTFEAMIMEAGFTSLAEFDRLVATTNISTPDRLAEFKLWQECDGTKEGLINMIRRIKC